MIFGFVILLVLEELAAAEEEQGDGSEEEGLRHARGEGSLEGVLVVDPCRACLELLEMREELLFAA